MTIPDTLPVPVEREELEIKHKSYRLEIIKAIASVLTPLVLVVLTFQVQSVLKEKESELKIREQVLTQKQELYEEVGSRLNKIYVYINDVGDFRQYSPSEIVQLKRETDRLYYMYKPFWSSRTNDLYDEFMKLAFDTNNGSGLKAKIRTSSGQKIAAAEKEKKPWSTDWDEYFTGKRGPGIREKYGELVLSFLGDISSSSLATSS